MDIEPINGYYDKKLNLIYFNGKVFIDQEILGSSKDLKLDLHQVLKSNEEGLLVYNKEDDMNSEGRYEPGSYMFYYCVVVAISLTLGAGVMSGLTVGYLSIDRLELELKIHNGTDEERKQALAVLPVLEDHHYLLVTLLLANALCMEALPIYLDAIVPSAYAILLSVIAVLFFGEVIPQAICTGPQQIKIGAFLAPFIQLLKIALGIVTYPIAKILDMVLGEHIATRYTNNDLKALIELHSYHALETLGQVYDQKSQESGLRSYQTKIIKSVIDFRSGSVKKIMVQASQIFSLNSKKSITYKVAKKVTKAGFSRIPVYDKNDKNKIIGIMLIKTLIGLDLKEGRTISQLVEEGEVTLRKPIFIDQSMKLDVLLRMFLEGKSHMAIVTDNPEKMEKYVRGFEDYAGELSLLHDENILAESTENKEEEEQPKVLGLLTLEDLFEYIIKEDILDEGDYDNDMDMNRNPYVNFQRSNTVLDTSAHNAEQDVSMIFLNYSQKPRT
jgi:metal transporter CNNM